MKLINKEQVSHIVVFNETQGLGDRFLKYIHYEAEYFRLFWLFPVKTLEAGFYRSGIKESWYKLDGNYFDYSKHYILLNSIYTKCHIDIYSAGQRIHTEYFFDRNDMKKHIAENYNNCTIEYNT